MFVLGMAAADAGILAGSLGWAFAKVALAFALVFLVGRWVLRPLFHLIAAQRSAEVFTLTVLFVSLLAAWTTDSLVTKILLTYVPQSPHNLLSTYKHESEEKCRGFSVWNDN